MTPEPRTTEQWTMGIDAGSSSVKVAVARSRAGDEGVVLATAQQRIRRREVREVVHATVEQALAGAGLTRRELAYVASTGDADAVEDRTGHFYGMTAHARGALHLDPTARAVLDIGALHARALKIDARGKVLGHRMTSQCASGSGQFLENIARYLGVALEDVGDLSCAATQPETVSSICAVLAETDVINMVSRGLTTPDILKGIHLSIAGRLAKLLRAVGADGTVLVTGGLAKDRGLHQALVESIVEAKRPLSASLDIRAPAHGILAGAIGAALLGAYRLDQLERLGRADLLRAHLAGPSAATL